MPIEIRLVPTLQIRTASNDDRVLDIPIVELAPSPLDSDYPQITRISFVAWGNPPDLATKILESYPQHSFTTPRQLRSPQRLRQNVCRLEGALPTNVNCMLQISVDYYDSDPEGKPILTQLKKESATCQLFSPKVPQQVSPKKRESPESSTIVSPPAIATVAQTHPVKSGKEYPGWLAVDFGTSNSTVTLFDNKKIWTLRISTNPTTQASHAWLVEVLKGFHLPDTRSAAQLFVTGINGVLLNYFAIRKATPDSSRVAKNTMSEMVN
ncbi:MAG: hypothetical protein F6K10_23490, partial [Moorea sp. SIO2B7]|nr:hypothetical protein [Moorena sp. SIO2B7]